MLKLVSKEVMDESFIYGNVDRQLTIVKIYSQVMEIRKKILEERSEMQSCQDWPMHVGPPLCATIAVM